MLDQRPELRLWVLWLATFLPVLPLSIVAAKLAGAQEYGYAIAFFVLSIALICGLAIGTFQNIILRKFFPGLRHWALATCVGLIAAWLLGVVFPFVFPLVDFPQEDELWYNLAAWIWAVIWFPTTLAQWLVLRKYLRLAFLWILVNALAAGAGYYIGSLVGSWFGVQYIQSDSDSIARLHIPPQAWIIGTSVATLTIAICTATILVWLWLQRRHTNAR